ncbi:protein translocase subunit SecD [Conyzicola nivalis]|uniref:Protein translocase subunit SecD n=1 Tax=Conyzicola nivalis TaxID=1477021 RepID=A0A916SHM7_9MICO|nr:protein translocase subunit SecD [Conyzicola nivalis]GGA96685.1 protein translocase subunit SecD [Conyzicola nivalis]
MARTTPVKKAWRSLAWLTVIIALLVGINGAGVAWANWSWTPKLALDLEGGTQIILAPQLEDGQDVTPEQLNQAVSIIRDRIDASGVSEAEITTQGDQNVVVSIPGTPDKATLDRIQSSAKLEFRPVLSTEAAATSAVGDDGSTATPTPTDAASPSLESTPSVSPTDASDANWITPALADQYTNFDCANLDAEGANVAPADQPLVTCDSTGTYKYILGPTEVAGSTISDATSGLVLNSQGVSTGAWGVNIVFDAEGTEQFADVTTRLFGYGVGDVRNQFAIVLDGRVISAPSTNAAITDGKPQISGSFDQETAKTLADQLKFGALPIGFEVQSSEVISSTLGSSQLQSGLIAGLIGLILVFGYSLFQYRLLGLVTVASLVVAAIVTYFVIVIMSWREGYRLSLAGVAGLIVAIGFTADSFIVYFERIRDELRDGRALVSAVEAGWKRALRTIFAAKAVNLLSAVVLFILAVGNVRGFALTLGVTTIIDVIIVVLFTHPVLQLLATTKYFSSGHPMSGLDPNALGAVYRGRAQFRTPTPATSKAGAAKEAARRQTIAERKAAELAGASSDSNVDRKDS